MDLPCDICNGDGFVSTEDRHVENLKEVCPKCRGLGLINAKTGEGPASSASPDGLTLYAHRIETPDGMHTEVEVMDAPRPVDTETIRGGMMLIDDPHHVQPKLHPADYRDPSPTRLTQLYRHDPDNGVYGDCCRTVYAMLLGFSTPEHVPHFGHDGAPDGVFWDRVKAWLGEMGYRIWETIYPGTSDLADIMRTQGMINPGVYWMLAGKSPRGTQHVVLCLGDAVWADPHPDGGGVVGPDDEGVYRVEVLVPVAFTTFRRPRGHEDLPLSPGPV